MHIWPLNPCIMTYVFAAIALIIVFIVISRIMGSGKKTSPATAEKETAQTDDEDAYLFDPKTGKRITLEQAMEGYEVEEHEKAMIVPEEGAEQEHTEEELALLRIQAWMMLESFGMVTKEELIHLLEQLNGSSVRKAYEENLEYLFASEPDPDLFLVITKVRPELGHGRQGSEDGEHQLLGILRLEVLPGNALIQPKQALNPITAAFQAEKEILSDKNAILLARRDESPLLLQLDAAIQGISNYVAEVHGEYLLIKSNNPATAEEADDLLSCLRNVRRALRD